MRQENILLIQELTLQTADSFDSPLMQVLAYIDPGSGLMLVQIITAAVCGVALSLRKVRTWIKGLFGKKQDKQD
ncbi:MAG: hypothetical protein HZC55_22845 [Verrucomicrobia bacterium]|nr:hypothetical protein [Verrucomicrobiota bacterium]